MELHLQCQGSECCTCVVCVGERERETERQRQKDRERETESDRERERERERKIDHSPLSFFPCKRNSPAAFTQPADAHRLLLL